MPSPPPHIAARRARQRAQIRRRRRAALAVGALVVAVVVAGLEITGGAGGAHSLRHRANVTAGVGIEKQTTPAASAGRLSDLDARGAREIKRLIQLGHPIFCGGLHGNEVAFTFDDGPGVYTHYAIKKLSQAHERATFFVVGHLIALFPGWLSKELKLGAIGDHTWTHPELTALPASGVRSQLSMTAEAIHAASDENVDLWRPPYELHDATTDQIARQLGLLEILWSVDSGDSVGANWAQIIKDVNAGLRPGMIILMHENRGQTIRALTTLLPELHRRHLQSVSVPELLATDPPSARQLREGLNGCGTGGRQLLLHLSNGG